MTALWDIDGQPDRHESRRTRVPLTVNAIRRLVSPREAAEILALSTKTVRRYIAAGDLDPVRLGRRTIRI